jgi:hypothetical protein
MMTTIMPIWLTVGVVLGGLHGASLWLATRRASVFTAATGLLRLLTVALVLVGAAFAGGVVPASVGWGLGFLAIAIFSLVRSKTS